MGYRENMIRLLRPLGIYELEKGYSGLELGVLGQRLDEFSARADEAEKESLLATAEYDGLTMWEQLFPYRPVAENVAGRRAAVAALLRIDGRSFTPAALNDTVKGSGYNATVEESGENMTVIVRFPDVLGVPKDFAKASERIESILPCHLQVVYLFNYPTFAQLEGVGLTWGMLEDMALDWQGFESTDWKNL